MTLFDKFGIHYDEKEAAEAEKHSSTNTSDREKLQQALLSKLESRSEFDRREDGLKELIDLYVVEIEHQYTRKEHMENRAGYLMTLWGVLMGFAVSNKDILKGLFNNTTDCISCSVFIIRVITAILGIVSLIILCFCLKSLDLIRYGFENRKINSACAAESIDMLHIRVLEVLTNILEDNERAINKKGVLINVCLIMLFAFILFIIVCSVL